MMSFLIDQGAYFLVEDFTQSSYAPWCKVAHQILEEEVGHPEFGVHFLEEQIRKLGPRACSARSTSGGASGSTCSVRRRRAAHRSISSSASSTGPTRIDARPSAPHRARDREAGPPGPPPLALHLSLHLIRRTSSKRGQSARPAPPKSRSKPVSSSSAVLRPSVRRCSTPARTQVVVSPSANT